jgi:hypothetical protein
VYSEEELGTGQVNGVITAVNTTIALEGHSYSDLFDHSLMLRANRVCLWSVEEQRVYNDEKEDRKKLGVCEEMVQKMHELAWLGSDNGLDGLVRKVTWVSAGIGYDLASRYGNVMRPDGKKALDHNTHTGDLVFMVRDGSFSTGTRRTRGGEDLRIYLSADRGADNDVLWVDIGPPTDKGIRLRTTQTSLEPRPIMRRSTLESLFLNDLCDWKVMSGRESN